ncbi:hypothetical protein [Pseudofrankia saprophytica]|uniref:hypothetical protein n=1 Tax=Pseudofrankia saprophytica TaxID=298655 RepID=UPI000234CA2F|nr:hypothetical protein [Pseudofrankia saprophytica]
MADAVGKRKDEVSVGDAIHGPGSAAVQPLCDGVRQNAAGSRMRQRRTAEPGGTPGGSAYEAYLREKVAYKAERRDRHTYVITATAVVAATSGMLMGLLFASGLQAPLPAALVVGGLVAVTGMLDGARRFYATVPEIEGWRRATEAQRRTARVLGQLVRSGHVVLHDRTVPGATLVLHHLVIGPSGVQVVTDQDGGGEVRYRRDGAWLDSLPLRGVLATTAALAAEVAHHLSVLSPPPAVEPILVAVDADVLWRDGTIDGVTLLGLREVVPHVLRRKPRLTAAQVAQLAETANRLFPPATGSATCQQRGCQGCSSTNPVEDRTGQPAGLHGLRH